MVAVSAPLDAAAAYARRGWPVFPVHWLRDGACSCGNADCPSPGKHPLTAHGVKEASLDYEAIAFWWMRWPDANIGIATGNGLLVLDVDRHAADGGATMTTLEAELGELPETATVVTGSGGVHLYFTLPPGVALGNTAGKLGPGVDTRGDGGYVVAPPSGHVSGGAYRWLVENADVAPLPETWLRRLQMLSARSFGQATGIGSFVGAKDSGRNSHLASLAGTLRARGSDETVILAALRAENARFAEPLDEAEVAPIARGYATRYPAGLNTPEARTNGTGPATEVGERPAAFMRTDLGNAERLVARHGIDLHYCEPLGGWLVWTGTHWQRDTTGESTRRAIETVRAMYSEAAALDDAEARASLAKHAAKSESAGRIAAMLTLAQALPGVALAPEAVDRHPWLLACANGTLDLETGVLREHRRAELLTRCLPVAFDPDAACPIWRRFISRIMAGNPELVAFVQRAIGYSLTGDTSERCFFLLHGGGKNGKSTLLETVGALLGDYARTAEAATFMERNQERVSNDLAMLAGARFVAVTEGGSGQRLHEQLVKRVTGRDAITARFLFREHFSFAPTFKLWLGTNHKPDIRDGGAAMWDRVLLVPFTVRIPETEQDKHLLERLAGELPGILAWALAGCADWRRRGDLAPPPEVRAATLAYREEMDPLGAFIAARCQRDELAEVTTGALFVAYSLYCERVGERPLASRTLGLRLAEQGFSSGRLGDGTRIWRGLRLNESAIPPFSDASTLPTQVSYKSPREETNKEGIGNVCRTRRCDNVAESGDGAETVVSAGIVAEGARHGERGGTAGAGDAAGSVGDLGPAAGRGTGGGTGASGVRDAGGAAWMAQAEGGPVSGGAGQRGGAGRGVGAAQTVTCWACGCFAPAVEADPETGDWCAAHYDRSQLLSLASLSDFQALTIPGYGAVGGVAWKALARNGTDEQRAAARAALTQEPLG